VNDLVVSQEDTPQTHRTVSETSRETGIRLILWNCHHEFGSCLLLEHGI